MMVGRQIGAEGLSTGGGAGEVRLKVRDLRRTRGPGHRGSARGCRSTSAPGRSSASPACRATASASSGRRSPACGPRCEDSVQVDGAELAGKKASAARAAGLGYVPEERMRDGVIGDFTRGRKPHAGRLRQARVRASRVPAPRARPRPGEGARSVVRRAHAGHRHAHPQPVGRQHPKAHPGPRAFGPAEGPSRSPSPPGASMSPRPATSTSGCAKRRPRASPSSSSPRTSTRSSPSPTGPW